MQVMVFIRYKHYDILQNRFRDVDDCFSQSIEMFKMNLLKYPGLAGSVRYGKRVRPDLMAWIIMEVTDRGVTYHKEFPDVFLFTDFVKKNSEIAKALKFTI